MSSGCVWAAELEATEVHKFDSSNCLFPERSKENPLWSVRANFHTCEGRKVFG